MEKRSQKLSEAILDNKINVEVGVSVERMDLVYSLTTDVEISIDNKNQPKGAKYRNIVRCVGYPALLTSTKVGEEQALSQPPSYANPYTLSAG